MRVSLSMRLASPLLPRSVRPRPSRCRSLQPSLMGSRRWRWRWRWRWRMSVLAARDRARWLRPRGARPGRVGRRHDHAQPPADVCCAELVPGVRRVANGRAGGTALCTAQPCVPEPRRSAGPATPRRDECLPADRRPVHPWRGDALRSGDDACRGLAREDREGEEAQSGGKEGG
jgi:hypothetical protein